MTPERHDQVHKLFEAASNMPPEGVRAFLEQECGTDEELRAEVESLLAHDANTTGPLKRVLLESTDARTIKHPSQIASYRIVSLLGEGGFGYVYLAEQQEPVRRKVAVKVLKPGMDSAQILARFEVERQALALMNHENVARVLDAGTTDQGRPYFVMELVQGARLTHHCDQKRLTIRERLDLFIHVCDAAQHAHQKGVIHRDLKPSNILVQLEGDEAVPKVIDFGIAKAVNQRLSERTVFTERGQLIGTPEYMSPEQADWESQDIDTRSDIYSLGVLLYELLTGSLPFDLRNASFTEIIRIVREVDPQQPSSRIDTMRTKRVTEGDGTPLVTRSPERHGQSTTPLSDSSMDVIANNRRIDPRTLGRTVRGDLDWIVMKCLEKDRTRRYDTAAALQRDIRHYLQQEPVEAGPPSRVYRLRRFVQRHRWAVLGVGCITLTLLLGAIGTAIGFAGEARQRRLASQKADLASQTAQYLKGVLAGVDPSMAQGMDRTLLKMMLRRASLRVDGDLSVYPVVRADLHDAIGQTYRQSGLLEEARPHLESAHAIYLREYGERAERTLHAQHELALLYDELGDTVRAEQLAKKAWEYQAEVLGAAHSDTLASRALYGTIVARQSERAEEGQGILSGTLQAGRQAWGADSARTATLESNLAGCYKRADRLDIAIPLYEHALGVLKSERGADDPETLSVASNLAGAYSVGGELTKSVVILEDLVPRCRRILGEEHPQTLRSLNNLGAACDRLDRLNDAEQWYRLALTTQLELLGPNHPDVLTTRSNLAIVLYKRSTPESLRAAEDMLNQVLQGQAVTFGAKDVRALKTLNTMAMVYDKTANPEAGPTFERLLQLSCDVQGESHVDTLVYMSNAAYWFQDHGNDARARELFERAAEVSKRDRGEADFATLWASSDFATYCRSRGEFERALEIHRAILSTARSNRVEPQYLGVFLTGYGKTLMACHKYPEAVTALAEAHGLLAQVLGPESPQLASTKEALEQAQLKAAQ